ncbi:hypothetical protein N7495_007321 [Penicillium taxi]|uniref:uncharacterized protein n=1 Tax=Penicillium taxi TaxID=168475 RepID=UPI002544D617|nr:uncharacterized protein N7495_007321 [Penicillium taxi]KAJ5895630.1 hypothetical protein N7495_007321 [Penicillium taxi]
MASEKTARARDGIHFVNARPASETERLKAKRLVRAHVGRWISNHTKDRAESAISTTNTDSIPSISSLSEATSDFSAIPSTSTSPHGTDVRRGRAKENGRGRERGRGRELPIFGTRRGEWPRSSFPPSKINDSECSSDAASEGSPNLTALVAWQHEDPKIEMQIFGKLDPFNTAPTDFPSDIVDTCQSYCSFPCFPPFNPKLIPMQGLNVLWPGLLPSRVKEAGKTFFPMAMSDPALYMAFMFGSLCHQRVQWLNGWSTHTSFTQRQERMLELCEMEAIQRISDALHDPNRALSDAVLLSVICMAHHQAPERIQSQLKKTPFNPPLQRLQWLDVYGCLPPNMIHIQGLVQLVRMRGGLDAVKARGLPATISFSDIMTTSCYCVSPVFDFRPIDELRIGISLHEMLGFSLSDFKQGFGRLVDIDVGITSQMARALQGAQAYIEIAKRTFTDSYDATLLADQRNFTQYHILRLPPAKDIYFQLLSQRTTYEACRLAMLIFGVSVVFPIPAQNNPLHILAQQLYKVLCQPDSSDLWSSSTTLTPLIWILCLGGIASSDAKQRAFFASALFNTAQRSGLSSWLQVKRTVEMMLWWDIACDEPAEVLWLEAISIE